MVEAVNNQRNGGGTIVPQVLCTAAGVGIGGYALRGEVGLKHVLKADKFELSKETVDSLTDEQKDAYNDIRGLKSETTPEAIHAEATDTAKDILKSKKSISTKQYLKSKGINSETELQKSIETYETSIQELEEKLATTKGTRAQNKVQDLIKAKHTELSQLRDHLDIISIAEDGKITKESLISKFASKIETENTTAIKEALETLKGKLPKVKFSGIKGAVGALVGLVAGVIVAKVVSSKNTEH